MGCGGSVPTPEVKEAPPTEELPTAGTAEVNNNSEEKAPMEMVPEAAHLAPIREETKRVDMQKDTFSQSCLQDSWEVLAKDKECLSRFASELLEDLKECENEVSLVAFLLVSDSEGDLLLQTVESGVLFWKNKASFTSFMERTGAKFRQYGGSAAFFDGWRNIFFKKFPAVIGDSLFQGVSQEWEAFWNQMVACLSRGNTAENSEYYSSLFRDRNAVRLKIDVDLIKARESDGNGSFISVMEAHMLEQMKNASQDAVPTEAIAFIFEAFFGMVPVLLCDQQLSTFLLTQREKCSYSLGYLSALLQPFLETCQTFIPEIWNSAVEYRFSSYYSKMINTVSGSGKCLPGGGTMPIFLTSVNEKSLSSIYVHSTDRDSKVPGNERLTDAEYHDSNEHQIPLPTPVGAPEPAKKAQDDFFTCGERVSWTHITAVPIEDSRQCSAIPVEDHLSQALKDDQGAIVSEKDDHRVSPESLDEGEKDNRKKSIGAEPHEGRLSTSLDEAPKESNVENGDEISPVACENALAGERVTSFTTSGGNFPQEVENCEPCTSAAALRSPSPASEAPSIDSVQKLENIEKPSYGAILCVAIANTTSLWESNSELMSSIQQWYFRLFRSLITRYRCHEVKVVGDSFVITSQNVVDGLRLALGIQLEVARISSLAKSIEGEAAKQRWPSDSGILSRKNFRVFPVRISLESSKEAVGSYNVIKRRWRYFGDSMNHCAQLEYVANGGQILLSRDTYTAIIESDEFSSTPCDPFLHSLEKRFSSERVSGGLKEYVVFQDAGIAKLKGLQKSTPLFAAFPKCLFGSGIYTCSSGKNVTL